MTLNVFPPSFNRGGYPISGQVLNITIAVVDIIYHQKKE